jgi:2-C-methyl-D-erythritol 4-phosphate cytidylyltransferase
MQRGVYTPPPQDPLLPRHIAPSKAGDAQKRGVLPVGMAMNVSVLIPAAGHGRRMGGSLSKPYLEVAGRPILAHTLSLFQQHAQIDQIYLVVSAEAIEHCRREIVERFAFSKVKGLVVGGAERQASVYLGLQACAASDDDLILVHDGVRPLATAACIDRLLPVVARTGAAVVAVPVKDTIKEVAAGLVLGTPERARLWQVQTPQGFRAELLRRAHQQALSDGFLGTDDAALVEHLGEAVAVVEGDYRNIKITTADDLLLAHTFLTARGA